MSEHHPVESPEDHMLLNLGSEVYRVSPDADDLLHFLIKDAPIFVRDQKIKINVKTAGQRLLLQRTACVLATGFELEFQAMLLLVQCPKDHILLNI